ncbi:MAG: hypothetical protein KA538_04855, partial [Azonexus sp.]|nr:hypothetical protein [Azonexus sp.]
MTALPDPSPMSDSPIRSALLSAINRVLSPVVRVMLAHEITLPMAVELLKRVNHPPWTCPTLRARYKNTHDRSPRPIADVRFAHPLRSTFRNQS